MTYILNVYFGIFVFDNYNWLTATNTIQKNIYIHIQELINNKHYNKMQKNKKIQEEKHAHML